MVLADLSIKRPVLMTMVIFTFVVIGLFSLTRLGIDLFPEIDFPFVTVTTVYPGAGPEEIETLLAEPLEDAASSVSGVKTIYSIAQEGVSVTLIELQLGEDVDIRAIDIKDKVDAIRNDLPDDIQDPIVQKFDMGASAIVNLAVIGDLPLEDLYLLVDQQIRPELQKIPGLANVDVIGEKEREIRVELSTKLMRAYQINPMQIVGALTAANLDIPAGRIEKGRSEYTVRVEGELEAVDEIRALQLQTASGPIRLDAIANVVDDFAEMRELARFNGTPSIGLNLVKRSDANTVQVADDIFSTVERLQKMMPAGVDIKIASDSSKFIRDSVADVSGNLVLGILFTALVLFLFLHSWRGTVIAAVAMPISIVSTFTLLEAANFTINVMSLMGLAISVGILVVNAIVVLENIERLREEGLSLREAASKGTGQIAVAVSAATLTNIVVFTPMAFMAGIIGPIFRQFGLTVAFATIFSLLVSFTLTPMMASQKLKAKTYAFVALLTLAAVWIILGPITAAVVAGVVALIALADKLGGVKAFARGWDKWYNELASDYRIGLSWAIKHRFIILGLTSLIFVFGLFLFSFIGSEFFPSYDERRLRVAVEMPAGSRLEETDRVLQRVEEEVSAYPEVKSLYTALGQSGGDDLGSATGVQYGYVFATLADVENNNYPPTSEVVKELRGRLADVPAAEILVMEATQFGGGSSADIQIQLQGRDQDDLVEAADKTIELIRSTGNAVDVRSDWETGKPEIVVRPDRIKMADRGVSVQEIAGVLRTFFEGATETTFREAGEEYDIRVQLREEERNRVESLEDLLVQAPNGFIPLKAVADIRYGTGPTQINRKNKLRMVTVSANSVNITTGELQTQIAEVMRLPATDPAQLMKDILRGESSTIPVPSPLLPDGVNVYFGGDAENMASSFTSLLQALVLAIVLTYMLLAAILESYRFPLIIMMTLPLALIGVSMGLVMTGMSISMFSLMAIVMLVGIVVNNGILLIDYTQELRRDGNGLVDAVLTACPVRLRPILMSSLATALGMMPLALGIGAGGEFRAPMAVVAIGGLLVSTALGLFVIPVLFVAMELKGEKKRIAAGETVS
ncbi:efflux RND transporter permease subunit [bacterium]|nr:efflux RND transporter permease subunit [bacterium]